MERETANKLRKVFLLPPIPEDKKPEGEFDDSSTEGNGDYIIIRKKKDDLNDVT